MLDGSEPVISWYTDDLPYMPPEFPTYEAHSHHIRDHLTLDQRHLEMAFRVQR
jgi:hypothetical protein